MKNSKRPIIWLLLCMLVVLTGCSNHHNRNSVFQVPDISSGVKKLFSNSKNDPYSKDFEISEKEMYKILEESGYGKDIDWANKTDDDPSIPKSMDITRDKKSIRDAYYKMYTDEYEPGDSYEKAWWDYIPDSYNLAGDVFPATANYAGEEKQYNNSLEQNIIDYGYTSGQLHDIGNVKSVAGTFIYEEMKSKYNWLADLEQLCRVADKLDIADFYSRESDRPMYHNANEEWMSPGFMTAYYNQRIVDYDLIGIPQFGGYKFNICVWEDTGLVGWVDDIYNTGFLNEDEVYENMGEWDFYDTVEATSWPKKVEAPKLPNGAMILKGKNNLAKEQYVHKKISSSSGTIYYYSNGVTVDMEYYGGKQGGNYKDALNYCRIICGNEDLK